MTGEPVQVRQGWCWLSGTEVREAFKAKKSSKFCLQLNYRDIHIILAVMIPKFGVG